MTSDADIARICASSYDPNTKWDRLWDEGSNSGIFVGLIGTVVCFRGSVTLEDWMRDLDALYIDDPTIGGVHAGFAKGIAQFFASTEGIIRSGFTICGHSLGAARALIFAGYMVAAGLNPAAAITFGTPRPGFQKLTDILAPLSVRSYKNRFDPVCDVPAPILPDFPYIHPRAQIKVDAAPPIDEFGLFADHHIELYVNGVDKLIGGGNG